MKPVQRPLHPSVLFKDIPYVLPSDQDVVGDKVGPSEIAAIAMAIQTLLPQGDIENGEFFAHELPISDWFSSALSAQCERRL